ncbi:MAG: TrkH family potassium uptake protein [Armatimonadota bacterium]|nr:TrkH family potassium uptake protein [Armatimonadota bacterium]MDR7437049.1 TrkH family potassium uptake protein [Armatimonadota bacterium]MDR7472880.1 TrkH family potassium uptake protein [Armatimonadota bacterium]MDR7507230.1 TrkH family potassium uptake protein [Armatimonadota bacterium]MDR7508935.1 TrkH family potassium uptake protein [Armatimonadota bacterium]
MARVVPARPAFARLEFTPAQSIIAGFAAVIVAGAVALSLPAASADGTRTPFLTALFTATSATCVTGLVVVDTADHYSTFGEVVILTLIQLGGLGYMTVATLLAMAVGRRIGLRERLVLQEAYNLYTIGGVVRLTRMVVLTTLAIEAAGAVVLALRWVPRFGWGRGLYYSVFHSISAFNNAGFDLMGGFRSLTAFAADVPVNLTLAALIVAGGLGFTVLADLPRPRRYTLHARVVLTTTAVLIAAGTALILALESANPATLGGLSWGRKVLAAFFQSVTPRTAGFNTVDIGRMREPTLILLVVLMFIGASPGGTGGGIKTTTFVAPLAVILSMLRGRPDPELFRRRLPPVVVYKAVTIALLGIAFVLTMGTLLALTEGVAFVPALFEIASAFGTVGLSTGLTPHLSPVGRILVMATVFTGRVGLLTVAFALTRRQRPADFRYPEERVYIG